MKVGVFTVILRSMSLEKALDYLAELGVETVEIGTGAYTGTDHCDANDLLASDAKANAFLNAIHSRGLKISCLSVHGNPIHPNPEIADQHHAAFERCIRLAAKLEVENRSNFQRMPRRFTCRSAAELGHMPLATGISRHSQLPMERCRSPLLD
jgi:sugar phosphate isomerase/epimerase